MENTGFYRLATEDYNIFHLFAMYQKWENQKVIHMHSRKTSGLLYLQRCTAVYRLDNGEQLNAPQGSVVFLPQGSSYRCTFSVTTGEKALCQLVEFALRAGDGSAVSVCDRVTLVGRDENPLVAELFTEAVEAYNRPMYSPPLLKSAVYQLIAQVAGQNRHQSISSQQLAGIRPALNCLEKELMPESVAQLAQMCHMSEVSFRKKFRQYAGMPPSAYLLNQKLRYAKRLLRGGLYTVAQAAELAGFDDPSYFSKVFKKHTGILPGEYMRRYAFGE